LRQRDEGAARLAAEENERQMRLELERAHSEKVAKLKDRVEDFLAKYEEDAAAVERRFERLERAAAQRRMAVELEQKKWVELWNEKHASADKMIQELEQKLKASESTAVLKERLTQLQAEHEQLKQRVADEQEEIRKLSEGPGSERELLERMEKETRDERERIAKLERELDAKAMQQQADEEDLDLREEDLRMRKEELDTKMRVLQLRETAAKRMLELYQQQLAGAEKRCENLRAQRGQIEMAAAQP
jgi:hypothetical protein